VDHFNPAVGDHIVFDHVCTANNSIIVAEVSLQSQSPDPETSDAALQLLCLSRM
jgi:hypothetical protein